MPVTFTEQRYVATWPALRRQCTDARIDAQLSARRWRRWGRAIVLHNGQPSRREQCFVARAHGVRGSVLTAFSALELVGLRGWDRPEVYVLTPRGARNSSRSPVPVRFLERRDWAGVRVYPGSFVQIARQALLVAAGTLDNQRSACGLVVAAVQQRLVSAGAVRSELLHATTTRHRRQLLVTIADVEQGAEALSEIDFSRLCRRHGLPPPVRQAVRREPGGRRRYLDASWQRSDGRTLAVEVDGALHLSQRRWWADQSRQNEVALSDSVLLRYPSVVLRTDETTVAQQLRRGLLMT